MARTYGSKNKETALKKALRTWAEENTMEILKSIKEYGTPSEQLNALKIVLDKIVPRLQAVEVTNEIPDEEKTEKDKTITELFLENMTTNTPN